MSPSTADQVFALTVIVVVEFLWINILIGIVYERVKRIEKQTKKWKD